MTDTPMIIGGERVPGASSFGVVNPATGRVHAQAPDCSREQLDRAFDAASVAFLGWRADDEARRVAMRAAAAALFAAADRIAPVLTAEQGRPRSQTPAEVMGAGAWFRYYADLDVSPEVIQDDERARVEVHNRPMGVVAAIAPWNYPLILAAWKLAPALRAGNTVVLKPSPFTPLSTLAMGQVLAEVLPPGVVNVVTGGDDLGRWMTSHPVPRKVSFTGSVATGRHVAAAAAPDLKRVTLELGGNDAAVVLDDADVPTVADSIYDAAFMNCGQVCSAIKRVYVPERLHDELVDALTERAAATRVGDGAEPGIEMGPVNNRPQYERVKELVDDAVAHGASATTGGRIDGDGYFFSPMILTGLTDGVRIVDEEQFGPALPIVTYRDVDDAVARANGISLGLSGSVWSADAERATEVAQRLECGTAWVNTHLALAPHQPFGGFKWSGIGRENGPWGLASFTEVQTLHVAR